MKWIIDLWKNLFKTKEQKQKAKDESAKKKQSQPKPSGVKQVKKERSSSYEESSVTKENTHTYRYTTLDHGEKISFEKIDPNLPSIQISTLKDRLKRHHAVLQQCSEEMLDPTGTKVNMDAYQLMYETLMKFGDNHKIDFQQLNANRSTPTWEQVEAMLGKVQEIGEYVDAAVQTQKKKGSRVRYNAPQQNAHQKKSIMDGAQEFLEDLSSPKTRIKKIQQETKKRYFSHVAQEESRTPPQKNALGLYN
jgi:hypothetical protein